jgi:hypothetical protein
MNSTFLDEIPDFWDVFPRPDLVGCWNTSLSIFISIILSIYGCFSIIYGLFMIGTRSISHDMVGVFKSNYNIRPFVKIDDYGTNKIAYYKLSDSGKITIFVQGGTASHVNNPNFNCFLEEPSDRTFAIFQIDGYSTLSCLDPLPDPCENLQFLIKTACKGYTDIHMIGHSYGGTLLMYTLNKYPMLQDLPVTIDIWYSPFNLDKEVKKSKAKIHYMKYSFYCLLFRDNYTWDRVCYAYNTNLIDKFVSHFCDFANTEKLCLPKNYVITAHYSKTDKMVYTAKSFCKFIKKNHENTKIIKMKGRGHADIGVGDFVP